MDGFQGQVDKDDVEQGIGRKIYKNNGDTYEGEFKDGFQHGYGRMIYGIDHEIDYHIGEWQNGIKHGQGLTMFKDGEFQQGMWENGQFMGGEESDSDVDKSD